MNTIHFEIGLVSDAGCRRKGQPNQDTAEIVLPKESGVWHPPLLMVADGLGGELGGERASKLVTQVFRREYIKNHHPATDYLELLTQCVIKTHEALKFEAGRDLKFSKMSSTIVAVVLENRKAYLLNVGDSRAYIVREKSMIQISHDHSWVADQILKGVLTPEQARRHPYRSRLTMAINPARDEINPFTTFIKLEPSDSLLLCSDGLWNVVPESLIYAVARELPPQAAVVKLVEMANRSRGPDNISVVIARQKLEELSKNIF